MEGISTAWSIEIQEPPEPLTHGPVEQEEPKDDTSAGMEDGTSAVAIFEQTIKDPKHDTSMALASQQNKKKIEVETTDMQTFFGKQQEVLEQLKIEDEKDRAVNKMPPQLEMSPLEDNGRVNEHIGPVQFNMGGIQVDADDMLRKLKVRIHANRQMSSSTFSSNMKN